MPIKPNKKALYPENWAKISLLTRERAGWKCELCRVKNGAFHPITGGQVILTVHHINADPTDNRKLNLIALCQRCHNRLDQPFRRKKKLNGKLFICFLLILLIPAVAEAIEIRGGILAHDIANLWGHTKKEKGVDFNAEIIFSKGTIRPNLGLSINSAGHTSRAYGGLLFGINSNRWLVDFGLGLAFQINAIRNLGSKFLFRLSAEIGYKLSKHWNISILMNHISNANFALSNDGLDTLGVRLGYYGRK